MITENKHNINQKLVIITVALTKAKKRVNYIVELG